VPAATRIVAYRDPCRPKALSRSAPNSRGCFGRGSAPEKPVQATAPSECEPAHARGIESASCMPPSRAASHAGQVDALQGWRFIGANQSSTACRLYGSKIPLSSQIRRQIFPELRPIHARIVCKRVNADGRELRCERTLRSLATEASNRRSSDRACNQSAAS
jgi:hypothetical protein